MKVSGLRLKEIAVVASIAFLSACSSSPEVATSSPGATAQPLASPLEAASPSPDPTPSLDPSPKPIVFASPTAGPEGTPVTRQVLAPAKVLPIAALCSHKVLTTVDGNYTPTFCQGLAINVVAWKAYVPLGVNVMSLGRGATFKDVTAALCRDLSKSNHATRTEESEAYWLAAAYYGWRFPTAPINSMYQAPYCA